MKSQRDSESNYSRDCDLQSEQKGSGKKSKTSKRQEKMQNKQTDKDPTGHLKVKCKLCLQKTLIMLKSLKNHVKVVHNIDDQDLGRSWYIAGENQTVPEDPKFQKEKRQGFFKRESKTKRAQVQEEVEELLIDVSQESNDIKPDEFKKILQAKPENNLSQDDLYWYNLLVETLDSKLLQKNLMYFQSEEARKDSSPARKLIESAADNIGNFFERNDIKHIAYIFVAALLLGDATLKIFIVKFLSFPSEKIRVTQSEIQRILNELCGLDEIFSLWLSKNLNKLKDTSLQFLNDLSNKYEGEVRFSTVVSFQPEQKAKFVNACSVFNKGMSIQKKSILENAIDRTLESENPLNIEQMKQILKHVLKTDTKELKKTQLGCVASICEWPSIMEKNQKSDQLLDMPFYEAAAHSIVQLNPGAFEFYQDDSARLARLTNAACVDIKLSINHIQMATAALIGLNSQRERLQCCVVPAGQGKSRIEAALALMLLFEHKDHDVYLVYSHQGLLDRDKNEYQALLTYMKTFDSKAMQRLHYQVGLEGIQNKRKKSAIILDESDHVIFENLQNFYKLSTKKNFKFICFSATVSDSNEQGSEMQVLREMGYKIYKNLEVKSFVPQIHMTCKIETIENYRRFIDEQKKLRSVVIYAVGSLHGQLLELDGVKPVTSATPDEQLRGLGKKQGDSYQVLIIDDKYGGRGLDYRSHQNMEGICLIIAGTFSDIRTREQTLMRVGRHGEKSFRVQDSTFAKVDDDQNAQRKGAIRKVLQTIIEDKQKNPLPKQSQSQKEDKEGFYDSNHPQNKGLKMQAYENTKEKRQSAIQKGGTESVYHEVAFEIRQEQYGNNNQTGFKKPFGE